MEQMDGDSGEAQAAQEAPAHQQGGGQEEMEESGITGYVLAVQVHCQGDVVRLYGPPRAEGEDADGGEQAADAETPAQQVRVDDGLAGDAALIDFTRTGSGASQAGSGAAADVAGVTAVAKQKDVRARSRKSKSPSKKKKSKSPSKTKTRESASPEKAAGGSGRAEGGSKAGGGRRRGGGR